MPAQPPDLPADRPPEPDRDIGAARRTLRVLAALLIPPFIAGAAGLFALLMMAFASDPGLRDPELAERMVAGVMISIGLFGLCGIPAAFAVVAPPSRRKGWWWTCAAIAGLSVIGALTCMAFYIRAIGS